MAALPGYTVPDAENTKGDFAPVWSDANVFNTHPVAILDTPADDGPLTNTQPITENPVNYVGVYAPNFVDDFYNRMLLEPSVIDAGNVSSSQVRTVSLFNAFFEAVTLTSIVEAGTAGITLTGIAAPTLLQPLQTIVFSATISTEGPPDIDADYQFSFDLFTPLILHIGGSRVIVLPFQAIAGFEEELEWITEVLTSNDGTEQRIQHRQKPRQSFQGDYFVPYNQVSRADNIIYGWLGKRWAIAVWSESQIVSTVGSTDTIVCETGTTDIRAGGLIMIWSSTTKYEVIEVATVNSGNIILTRPTVNDYPRALLMPLRTGVTGGKMRVNKNGFDASVFAEFEVTDNILLAGAAPAQFLGEDIYFDEVLMGGGGFSDEYQNRIDRVDFGTAIEIYTPWDNPKVRRNVQFLCQNRAESWTFRLWLHRRDGKQRPFWQPSMESNFPLVMSGLVSNTLIVAANDWRGLAEKRNHLAIQYTDGTWRTASILGSAPVDDATYAIGIDVSLNVDASRITRVCFLTLKRLDTNKVTIEWIGNAVCQSNIPLLEISP